MKRFGKRAVWLIAVALLGFALIYSGQLLFSSKEQGVDIIVVMKSREAKTQFWRVVKAGIDTAAKEYGAIISYSGADSETDVEGQLAAIEDAIRRGPDAIVLAANDYRQLVPAAEKIKRRGIVLILIDSGLETNAADSLIATDNIAAGTKAGELLHRLVDPGSSVAIINYVRGSQTAIEREKGVIAGLKQHLPERDIVKYYCDDDEEKAYRIVKDLLERNRNIGGIAGLNETSTLGAARAIDEMGMNGRVKMVGFDNSDREVMYLEKGTLQSIVVQKPFNIGYLGIRTAMERIRGKKVPSWVDTGSDIIAKENMSQDEHEKVLFPLIE